MTAPATLDLRALARQTNYAVRDARYQNDSPVRIIYAAFEQVARQAADGAREPLVAASLEYDRLISAAAADGQSWTGSDELDTAYAKWIGIATAIRTSGKEKK